MFQAAVGMISRHLLQHQFSSQWNDCLVVLIPSPCGRRHAYGFTAAHVAEEQALRNQNNFHISVLHGDRCCSVTPVDRSRDVGQHGCRCCRGLVHAAVLANVTKCASKVRRKLYVQAARALRHHRMVLLV